MRAVAAVVMWALSTLTWADTCPNLQQQAQVTLADYLARSLCANTASRAAWQRVQTQQAQRKAANADYLPSLSASATQQRQLASQAAGTDPDSTSLSVNASWLLWDFGARAANVAQSQALLESLGASADAQLQSVALSAIQAWYNRAAALAALSAAEASYRSAEETARAAQKRMDVGLGTREDLLQAQTALAQADLLRIQRKGELASADGQLAVVANYTANTAFNIEQALPNPAASAATPARDTLLSSAIETRAEVIAQQRQVDANRSQLDNLAAQRYPKITGNARYGQTHNNARDDDSGSLGVTLSVPLFTGWRQTHQERALASQIIQQDIELERIQQQISLEVWQAWQQLDTALARVQATDRLLDAASESNRAALARYEAGLGSLLNLLTAQSNLADARQQQARARFDWASARIQLARASGLIFDATFGLGAPRT